MGTLLTFATALEWSALTPAWALREILESKSVLWFCFGVAHLVVCSFFYAALASPHAYGSAEECKDRSLVDRQLCRGGVVAYAGLGMAACWIIVVARAHQTLQANDFMALASRSFSIANFVALTPLYDKPNLVDKLVRYAIAAAHVMALPVIIFVAMVARSWWAAWKCYTVLSLPQGLLDHDYGVCNPPNTIGHGNEEWFPFLYPPDADPDRPIGPDGHEYTYLDPWRSALYFAVHVETFAVALYSIAVFRPQSQEHRALLQKYLPNIRAHLPAFLS